jgi:hypothetical protein
MQLQGAAAAAGQTLANQQQQQQLLQQQLLKQAAAQQGVAGSQGLQFGGSALPPVALLQQQLQQQANAAQLRSMAQMNAQQEALRRQQQAQLLQQQLQLRQQAQIAQAQAQQAQQQQSANQQQAINAATLAALRASTSQAEQQQQQMLRWMAAAAAAGKTDSVGTLPSQLSTATTTAAIAQRQQQLLAGLNAQQKAALQGLAGAAAGAASGSAGPASGSNAAATQAMLSQLLANRSFEPANPARVGVIGQDRGKQVSTDLGNNSLTPGSTPLPAGSSVSGNPAGSVGGLPGGSSSSLNNFAALASGSAAGPNRQETPPPGAGSPSASGPAGLGSSALLGAAAAAGAGAGATAAGSSAAEGGGGGGSSGAADAGGAAALMGSAGLPLSASPEHVEAFLKTVGKRFAAMGLTIEQALEFNILKGLTKEQLAVLSESQNASMFSAAAEGSAAMPVASGSAAAVGLPVDLSVLGASSLELGLPSALAAVSEVLPAGAGGDAPAGDAGDALAVDSVGVGLLEEDEDDKRLESLLEPEDKPGGATALTPIDEATAATLLAMAQADADFNAFTYGFFDDPSSAGGLGDLLGELEPDGGGMCLEEDPAAVGIGEVS